MPRIRTAYRYPAPRGAAAFRSTSLMCLLLLFAAALLPNLVAAAAAVAPCGTFACLRERLFEAGDGFLAPFATADVDVAACAATSCPAVLGPSAGGPLLFSADGTDLCCAFAVYNAFRFGSAAGPAGGGGTARAVVVDALLSNESVAVGGMERPLVHGGGPAAGGAGLRAARGHLHVHGAGRCGERRRGDDDRDERGGRGFPRPAAGG
jgi:hypothetical protein